MALPAILNPVVAQACGVPSHGRFVTYLKLSSRAAYHKWRCSLTRLGFAEYLPNCTLGLQNMAQHHLAAGHEVIICEFPFKENDDYDEPCYNLFVILHRPAKNVGEKDVFGDYSSIVKDLSGVQVDSNTIEREILKIGTLYRF